MITVPKVPSSTDMGAIDPVIARNQAKIKSASIEASGNNSTNVASRFDRNQHEFDDQISLLMGPNNDQETNSLATNTAAATPGDQQTNKLRNSNTNNSFHDKAKKFLNISPGTLKPSASTSCLFTTAEDSNISSTNDRNNNDDTSQAEVSVATRASLTHEWKKLKTPNKCRECNLLVYFNGRECSFCGFVAHKKCVTVLVIKCSGQQLAFNNSYDASQVCGSNNKGGRKCGQRAASQQSEPLVSRQQATTDLQSMQSPVSSPSSSTILRKVKSPTVQPIFGQPIGSADSRQVIDFVRRFIYEIDSRGLTSKGIYRVSSIKSKVDRLCNYYDQNLSSLVDLSSFHPNIIANALKMYLRQLPEPLLTNELYNKLIDIAKKYSTTNSPAAVETNKPLPQPSLIAAKQQQQRKTCSPMATVSPIVTSNFSSITRPYSVTTASSRRAVVNNNPAYDPMLIVELKEILELLPQVNRELIAIIMRHLRRVADMSSENQMCAKNLSIIFGPTLLSADNKSLAIVDNVHQARVIELMITWAEQIFPQYANYESSAEIDLDLSETQPHWRRDSVAPENKSNYDKQKSFTNEDRKLSDKRQRFKDGRAVESGDNDDLLQPSTRTREDLRELRRQFFTVPNTTTNTTNTSQTSSIPSSPPPLPLPSTVAEASGRGRGYPNEKTKSINPPGSVPVIKVAPFYCNTLNTTTTTTTNTANKP